MRTRFLNIDYFSSAPTQFFQTLAFLHLPVHHLPNPHLSTIEDLIRFDSVPNVSLQIDRLPIDAALSKFFSGVLPQKIHVRIEDFNATVPSRNQKGESGFGVGTAENQISEDRVDEENGEECRSTLGPENLDSKFPRKNEWNAIGYKDTRVYKVIQFETHELDVFLENDVFSEEEKMEMLSEVPTDENNLGMLDPELSMHHPYEVLESIYSVEGVTSEYALKQTTYSLEDNCSLQDLLHFHQSTFPLLEEDEGSLRSFPCLCKEEEVGSFLENIEQQDLDEKYNSLILDKEGLGFVENNVLELISDLCLAKLCLEPEPASPKKLPGMEFMITLETSQVHQKSTLHGTSHVDCDFSLEPVVLQEFQFLDKDSSQNFESFFNRQTTCDPESIEWIFKKDLNFKNFDELVTSNELALIDDSFKSLPVPVISDYGKMICLYVIVEEILASLKPQPLSASDGIYLNWDLLEGDERNGRINFLYQNILAKIDSNSIDFDQELLDNGKLVLDLILSDDTLNGSYMEEYMELQKLLSDGNVLLDNHPVGVASSELLDDGYFKQETGEQIADRNAERASLLFKSMSEVMPS
ncbi:Protein SHORTAGE IN CHIASMATA 1 [Quillaja saponaria]|uniref:Protein SHORTAGE IN CHIASMATA 1 n=1 Tax=Quillaja saponaria TaxID=32244 RepID=A0AAD7VG25_QUISA|nr:Protein SHORTAGE IN CHIASMATA 1 [Quillaja saponaria]